MYMSDSYPDTITDYDLSSYDTTKKPEKIAEIVDEWYRKFLSCEIKRERTRAPRGARSLLPKGGG